jgi:hypothetical protein
MPQRIVTCASPAYITRHGTPRHPREIEQCVPMRDPSPENRFVARARGAIPRIARSPNHWRSSWCRCPDLQSSGRARGVRCGGRAVGALCRGLAPDAFCSPGRRICNEPLRSATARQLSQLAVRRYAPTDGDLALAAAWKLALDGRYNAGSARPRMARTQSIAPSPVVEISPLSVEM